MDAQAVRRIQRASELSPYRITRLRHLGELALNAGDPATAERSLVDVIERGKYSEFREPEDHVRLLQARRQLEQAPDAAVEVHCRPLRGEPGALLRVLDITARRRRQAQLFDPLGVQPHGRGNQRRRLADAQALLKASVGDEVRLRTPAGWETLELLEVSYPAPAA